MDARPEELLTYYCDVCDKIFGVYCKTACPSYRAYVVLGDEKEVECE